MSELIVGLVDKQVAAQPNNLSSSNNNAVALSNIAGALVNLGKYNESLIYSSKALAIDPTNTIALINKAGALVGLGKYNESLIYSSKALAIDRNNAVALSNIAAALVGLGKYNESLIYSSKALAIDPTITIALINKAGALVNLGKYNESLIYSSKALAIDPTNTIALKNKVAALANIVMSRNRPAVNLSDLTGQIAGTTMVTVLIVAVSAVYLFGRFYGFTRYSRIKNSYKRRIDATYKSLSNDKDECRDGLRQLRMEILEILNKGNIRHKEYEPLNEKISRYLDNINKG